MKVMSFSRRRDESLGSDSVGFVLLVIAAHLFFPGRGVELSGVLHMHERSGSYDAKV